MTAPWARPSDASAGSALAGDHGAVAGVGRRAARRACRSRRPGPSRRNATSSTASSTSGLDDDHDRGPTGPVAAQPRRDPGLGVGVDRRGRLDQHQDLRVAGQRPGQHQPLPLAAGERPAALGHDACPGRRAAPRGCRRSTRSRARGATSPSPPVGVEDGRRAGPRTAWPRCRRPRSGGVRRRGCSAVSGTPPRVTSSSTSGAQQAEPVGQRGRLVRLVADQRGHQPGPDPQAGARVGQLGAGRRRRRPGRPGRGGRASSASTRQTRRAATRARISLLAYSVAVRSGIIRNAE